MQDGSRKAVIAACIANAGIGIAKLVGFFFTGASSLLAEAVHSFADTGNQALLLFGASRASRGATEEHPFGYARERYFWAFMVALVIFLLGSVFAIYEGVHKWQHPGELNNPLVGVGILVFGILLEGGSFLTALKEANKARGEMGLVPFLKTSKEAELPVVLLEDLGALIGLVLASGAIGLAMVTGDSRYDGLGSIVIGVLLGGIAVALALKMHSLLIGEAASPEQCFAIERTIASDPQVEVLVHMRTTHLGPDVLLIGAKVQFVEGQTFSALSQRINDLEKRIRVAVPQAKYIYLEPDVLRTKS